MSGAISIEQTRTMIEAVRDIPPLPSFLKRTFFPNRKTFLTEEVDFDYMKGVLAMAPFVAPLVGGVPMERQGYETKSFSAPRISPERVISPDQLKKRSMGEAVYSNKTPAQRALEMRAADYDFLDRAIALREEWECRQLLFEGSFVAKGLTNDGKYIEMLVDYGFTNKQVLTGTDVWTNAASNPLKQMIEWRKDIVAQSGVSPNVLLMDSATAQMLLNNANFSKFYDIHRYNFGTIEPTVREDLLSYYGRIPILGSDLYAYDATFKDPDTGGEVPFVPANTVLFASTSTPGSIYYGAVTYMDNAGAYHTVALERVPLVYFDTDSSVSTLRVQSRPIPMPVNVDGWAVRQVA
jgi:hypothetical protein